MHAGRQDDVTHGPRASRTASAWTATLIALLLSLPAPVLAFSVGGTNSCIGPIFNHLICPPISQRFGAGIHQKITAEALTPFQYPSGSGTISFKPAMMTEIEDANAAVDGFQLRPERHFDACSNNTTHSDDCLAVSSALLMDGKALLLAQLSQPSITASQAHQLRLLFGTYLHTLQDFYAHTNFVNVAPGSTANLGTQPVANQPQGTIPCPQPGANGPLVYPTVQYLTSGWADQTLTLVPPSGVPAPYLTAPPGQCAHGAPSFMIDAGAPAGGMNKDDPERPFYQQAHDAALADTTNFANAVLLDASNTPDNVCMFMTDEKCSAAGGTVLLDFESVGNVNGLDATSYFASYGVTLTALTGPSSPPPVLIFSNPPNTGFTTHSGTNFIEQFPTSAQPASFQLALPGGGASSVSFWRTGFCCGTYLPQFTVTFYDGATAIGTVNGNQEFDPPLESYSFSAPSGHVITSVIFASNGFGFTGIGSTPIDDISFTPASSP